MDITSQSSASSSSSSEVSGPEDDSSGADSTTSHSLSDFKPGDIWYLGGQNSKGEPEPWVGVVWKVVTKGKNKGVHVNYLEACDESALDEIPLAHTVSGKKHFCFSTIVSGAKAGTQFSEKFAPNDFIGEVRGMETVRGDMRKEWTRYVGVLGVDRWQGMCERVSMGASDDGR